MPERASPEQATAAEDRLRALGCLDVTRAPYAADPSGKTDSTAAIQRAVNAARDQGLVCFFPEGTYLISDTISCEQEVNKLERPRHVDGGTQHYWPVYRPIVLLGSTRGKRPVLRLAPHAAGFDDPTRPKHAVWIWAQTWFDAPGKEEPVWGKEQANISFNHMFRGIDIDVRGHTGAIGIRHSGSQGSTMQDVTVYADGAYAGLNCCPGQGGGTHHVEVIGGQYGIVIEPDSRFPLLNACSFRGQTKAAIRYARGGSQVPTLLVGCQFEPASRTVVDLTTERNYAGLSLVDCIVSLPAGGVVFGTKQPENLYLENTWVRGANTVHSGGAPLPEQSRWTRIDRYSRHTNQSVNLVNGTVAPGEIAEWSPVDSVPDFADIRSRHYRPGPSFEDADAVNVRDFGAKGDGLTDDTNAFIQAIAQHDKIFVPNGDYVLTGKLRLRPHTHLFGLNRAFASLGAGRRRSAGGEPGPSPESDSFTIETVDDAEAAPGLSFLTVQGRVEWRSGRGTWMLSRASFHISGQGGGRFYGVMAMGRPLIFSGIRQPTALYALNVERVTQNPQSEFRNCEHLRVYYFKVEAGTIQRQNAGDGNTPGRIADSRDVRIYCMYGNVRQLGERPMLEVVNSDQILVTQLKAFAPSRFPHLIETRGAEQSVVPSTAACALFLRGL
ncbi:MAG: glycosyl hydrolase family 28-related protein [Pirellulaceae bacterium]